MAARLLAPGPGARADAAPSVESLRARLASVRAGAGAKLPDGALLSIEYTIAVAERIAKGFAPQSAAWRRRAARWLDLAARGRDPLVQERGKIVVRGYRSPVSERLQGYGIYLPPNYDPARAYPLLIMLHGGSSNGPLFLAVVLGNDMSWKQYPIHLWDEFSPRWSPDFIVVAPDGFGQVMWRWMGERDVLDVLADVRRHYDIDEDRVVLSGVSNGGVGAYSIGMRHAHLFSTVQAIAGAPSWLQYAGGRVPEAQRLAMEPLSAMQLGENAVNTDFRYYHGRRDPGPMRPRYVQELSAHLRALNVPFEESWFDTGHDLLPLVHQRGQVYQDLARARRKRRPAEVRVVTGDYRAARQHWVEVTRIERYPELARVRAVVGGDAIAVETHNALALSLDLREAPLEAGQRAGITVDGARVYDGPRAALGHVIHLVREGERWRTGFPAEVDGFEKKPGSSGPITDAYYGAIAHVYGTGDAAVTSALKQAAIEGARGWPLQLHRVEQKVVADTEVTEALMRSHHLVLYATSGSNRVLERIAGALPIRIESGAVAAGEHRIAGKGVGVRFIHPNPLAPERYVIVQAAEAAQAVKAGNVLPDFLPDYVVYSARTTRSRPRLVFDRERAPVAMGYFDRHWKLPRGFETIERASLPRRGNAAFGPAEIALESAQSDLRPDAPDPSLASKAPPRPPRPRRFAAGPHTQAGQAARRIAPLMQSSLNHRARIPFATWVVDPAARWSIRDEQRCLEELRAKNIHFRRHELPLATPVPTPVDVIAPVDGVRFQMMHEDRTLLMSCEMAARLPVIAAAVKPHGVRTIGVISTYREEPRASFHTMGLALDLWRFFTADDAFSVEHDFQITPGRKTCSVPPPAGKSARVLLDIACELARSRQFSSVLTPNYNVGHRDHFHIDIRPDDPRLFLK